MIDVILLQSAQADLLEIYCRHGEAAYHVVDAALESIRRMPEMAPTYHDHFRRKLVAGTPFGIFYSVVGTRIMVSFVMDLREDPQSIQRRLDKLR